MTSHDDEVPVMIVGGSLVGLSTSLLLASKGVPSLTVERHPGTAIHPRAAMFNQRTIEIYRGVGLEAEIVEAADLEFEQDGAIVSVESLAGKELEYYFRNVNDGYESLSPSPRLFITQIGLEPILRRHADELGARLEYSTELVSIDQDENGVTAVVRSRDTGAERTVRCRLRDRGGREQEPGRERLGIPLRGHPSFSNSITDLLPSRRQAARRRPQPERDLRVRPDAAGILPLLAGRRRQASWSSTRRPTPTAPATATSGRSWTTSAPSRTCARRLGAPELAVEIENVQQWNACAEWADRFADGRIFLAGDAAHNMPPTGGFGATRVWPDGHNLAWKLAQVLDGAAGPGLLHDVRRGAARPVGEFTTRAGLHALRHAARPRAREGGHPTVRPRPARRAPATATARPP